LTEITVTGFRPEDRDRWAALWREYLGFYGTTLPADNYEHTWRLLLSPTGSIHGFGARIGGAISPLVGITHYLFHAHAWSPKEVCYLQDLFVDPTLRSQGIGAALIDRVAAAARARNCLRLYWLTKEDNAPARRLYDRLAHFNGFIRYDHEVA